VYDISAIGTLDLDVFGRVVELSLAVLSLTPQAWSTTGWELKGSVMLLGNVQTSSIRYAYHMESQIKSSAKGDKNESPFDSKKRILADW